MANKPTPGIEKHMAMRPQSGTAWILKPSATAWTPGIGGWSGQSRVLAGHEHPDQWKRQQSRRRPGRFLECGYAAACRPVEKDGSHQRPRYRRSREARQIWPDDRPYEGRLPHLGPRGVRLFQWGHRTAALPQQEVRRQQMVSEKVQGRPRLGRATLSGWHVMRLLPRHFQPGQAAAGSRQPEMGESKLDDREYLFPRRHAVRP